MMTDAGYDHSYHFISTFMADRLAWHAERLGHEYVCAAPFSLFARGVTAI